MISFANSFTEHHPCTLSFHVIEMEEEHYGAGSLSLCISKLYTLRSKCSFLRHDTAYRLTGLHICPTESSYQNTKILPKQLELVHEISHDLHGFTSVSFVACTDRKRERHKLTCSRSSLSSRRLSSQMSRVSNPWP